MLEKDQHQQKLFATYQNHPISYKSIMARLANQNKLAGALCENDFAIDIATQITDQNHIGGKQASIELIQQLNINQNDKVLDIGSGLGGTARLLVEMTGCHVDGNDIFPDRIEDAKKLTDALGMTDKINYFEGDFLSLQLKSHDYDYIICQSAFVHFINKTAFFKQCRDWIKPNGILVIEDSFLDNGDYYLNYESDIEHLENIWVSQLISMAELIKIIELNNMSIVKQIDMNAEFSSHFQSLLATFEVDENIANDAEKLSWLLAVKLREKKFINYYRLLIQAGV